MCGCDEWIEFIICDTLIQSKREKECRASKMESPCCARQTIDRRPQRKMEMENIVTNVDFKWHLIVLCAQLRLYSQNNAPEERLAGH